MIKADVSDAENMRLFAQCLEALVRKADANEFTWHRGYLWSFVSSSAVSVKQEEKPHGR